MQATSGQKLRTGIFTLGGIIILLAALFAIGSKKDMFTRTFVVNGYFRNVGGLQVGNSIRYSGIDIGSVTDISVMNDTTIKVAMKVREKIHPFLKTDATASIGSDGLMGDKLINISAGNAGQTIVKDGDVLRTVPPVEFDKILDRINNVAANAEEITSSLAGIAHQVSAGKGSIGRLIYSDSLERGLEHTISSAHQTVKTANEGAQGFKENMDAMKHNFLLKGYFKKQQKKERKMERKAEKAEKAEQK